MTKDEVREHIRLLEQYIELMEKAERLQRKAMPVYPWYPVYPVYPVEPYKITWTSGDTDAP